MEKIDKFIDMLKDGDPFCVARFNDGELLGIRNVAAIVARGDQRVGMSLSSALAEALAFKAPGYFVGVPCPNCFAGHHLFVTEHFDLDEEGKTMAVVFTNDNWVKAWKGMLEAIGDRPLKVICGHDQDWKPLERGFDLNLELFRIPARNSWAHRMAVMDLYQGFSEGSVVMLSCGPLSRVLAHRWWKERQDITILDVGSTYDPFTRNVWHSCHKWENGKNEGARCDICNKKGIIKLNEDIHE